MQQQIGANTGCTPPHERSVSLWFSERKGVGTAVFRRERGPPQHSGRGELTDAVSGCTPGSQRSGRCRSRQVPSPSPASTSVAAPALTSCWTRTSACGSPGRAVLHGSPRMATFVPGRTSHRQGSAVGWGFGDGLRAEVEGITPRMGSSSSGSHSARLGRRHSSKRYGAMVNVLYDFTGRRARFEPYVGAGVGYQWAKEGNVHVYSGATSANRYGRPASRRSFAYQAILGLAMPIAAAPGLALTAEYRFMGLSGSRSLWRPDRHDRRPFWHRQRDTAAATTTTLPGRLPLQFRLSPAAAPRRWPRRLRLCSRPAPTWCSSIGIRPR